MSSDERGNSLADQAAAWVPPWARQPAEPQPEPVQRGIASFDEGPLGVTPDARFRQHEAHRNAGPFRVAEQAVFAG